MVRPAAPRSRVFISSVVDGFGEFRASARAAVIEAGGDPILVNEDFPSLTASSRNACLDAVESSDIYVGIIGTRGGWVAPSGMLVVEEEWRHARARKRHTLFFLQTGARDPDAERLAIAVSDYVDGTLRRTFTTPEDLRREMVRALSLMISQENVSMLPEEFLKAFTAGSQFGTGEPSLRVVIAPERREEVVDPIRIGSETFGHQLLEIGHRGDVGLFDYAVGKSAELKGALLIIMQQSPLSARSAADTVCLAFSERGIMSAEVSAADRSERDSALSLMHSLSLSTERVGSIMRRVMAFYGATLDLLDPYKLHQTFYCNVALEHLGHMSLVRNPEPRSSYPLNMRGGHEPVVAYREPRVISRQDLGAPDGEIERVLTLLLRNSTA